jgi:pimeloyl-ACP methyl ester carboxylesterase
MPSVNVNGLNLYYDEHGIGSETLVLVHGFTQARTHWRALIDQLPLDKLRVLAFDMRGHGRSDAPASGYGMSQMADDVAEATQSLGLQSFHFAGHSMGCQVGVALASRRPERLRSLTLVAPPPLAGAKAFDPGGQLLEAAREATPRAETYWPWIETWAARRIPAELLAALQLDYEPMTQDHLGQVYEGCCEDLSGFLPTITTPTLVVAGEKDLLRDFNLADAARIPGRCMQVFYGVGHMIEMEAPKELARLMVDFMGLSGSDIFAAKVTAKK